MTEQRQTGLAVLYDIMAGESGNISVAAEMLTPALFGSDDLAAAYVTMCEMYEAGERVDLLTVRTRIARDTYNEILKAMSDTHGLEIELRSHCRALAEIWTRNRQADLAVQLQRLSLDSSHSIDEVMDLTEQIAAINDLLPARHSTNLKDAWRKFVAFVEATQRRVEDGEAPAITTGIKGLDTILSGGFRPGELDIIAARPSVGKTAFAVSMTADQMAAHHHPLIISLEMTNNGILQRMAAKISNGRVTKSSIRQGTPDWEHINTVEGVLASYGWSCELDDSSRSIEAIVGQIRNKVRRAGVDIVYIDYLGLIQTDRTRNVPLYQQLGEYTRRLKALAKELEIPVVLLCQLNRQSESEKRSPELYDLRDSGSIEQDADIVIMLEKLAEPLRTKYNEDHIKVYDIHPLRVAVKKNREGVREASVDLWPDDTYSFFEEMTVNTYSNEPF